MLRAAQVGIEEHAFSPILVGRPKVIEKRLTQFGLSMKPGKDFEVINPQSDPR